MTGPQEFLIRGVLDGLTCLNGGGQSKCLGRVARRRVSGGTLVDWKRDMSRGPYAFPPSGARMMLPEARFSLSSRDDRRFRLVAWPRGGR